MTSGAVIVGNRLSSAMSKGGEPESENLIVSAAGVAFAATIAARSEPGPESFVLSTTNVAAPAGPAVVSPASTSTHSTNPNHGRMAAMEHLPLDVVGAILSESSRDGRIRTAGLLLPKQAR